jgi:hypothetical protein
MKKIILTITITVLFCYNSNAQFGEFGEFKLRITSFNDVDFFKADDLGNFPIVSGGASKTNFSTNDIITELTYSRFYPLNLSNYISWGLGYRYFNPSLNLRRNEGNRNSPVAAAISINQENYLNIPIMFHQFISIRSKQRDEELLTARSAIKRDRAGLNIYIGLNIYYSITGVKTEITVNENQEKTDELLEISQDLSKNFNRLNIEPELGLDILLGDFSFGFAVSHQLIKTYDNNEISVLSSNGTERPFELEKDFSTGFFAYLSISLKH